MTTASWRLRCRRPPDAFAEAVLADNPTWYAKHNEAVNATSAINYGSAGGGGTYVPKLSNSSAAIFTGGDVCWNNTANDYCDIPAACLPNGTDEFTLEIMVNEPSLGNYYALIDRDPEAGGRWWQWRLDAGGTQNFIKIVGGVQTVSGTGASVGNTCLLAVRAQADGTVTIWKNGSLIATMSVGAGVNWGDDTVGLRVLRRIQGDSANPAKCAASIVYDYALSDARLLVHAQEAGLAP